MEADGDPAQLSGLKLRDERRITSNAVIQLFAIDDDSPVVIADGMIDLSEALIDQLETRLSLQRRFEQDEAARRWEKLESLAEFAAGAGHEINNPVATITGRAAQLLRDETDPDRRRSLATIGGQALRIRDMIGDVMLFARPPEPQPESVHLDEVVERVVEQLVEEVEAKQCTVKIEGDGELRLFADVTQLEVVVSNLLRNSLEAIDDGGDVVVQWKIAPNDATRHPPADAGGSPSPALIEVVDNGRGFTEIERRHLFDPFFSGRQAGRGLGFGLCKCWRIVSNHGGCIDVESQPGRTRFFIEWPIATNDDSPISS